MIPSVSAIIVTRGDVALTPIIASLERPPIDEIIIWNNGLGHVQIHRPDGRIERHRGEKDISVYGRYEAISYARGELIYVQDDDCIVSNPQTIRDAWLPGHVVCNMPERFRHAGYTDSALVGFGSIFERDLPRRAFDRLEQASYDFPQRWFYDTCDVFFTTLSQRILVDVWHDDLPYASDMTRMWKQPTHLSDRTRALDLARQVRDLDL